MQALKLILRRMRDNVLSTFMICLVVGVAMSLPGLFYVGVDNLSKLSNHMQDETEISLYLKLDVSQKTISDLDAALAKNTEIKQHHFVSKEEAWHHFQEKSATNNEINKVVLQINRNPLPDAYFIQAKSTNPEALESLKNSLQKLSGVEQASLNGEWAKRLSILLGLGEKIILFIAALLAITLLIIIGNTVRMQILTQKDEIEVSNLMGATRSFIRTPFLYAGILYGLMGGLLAIAIMSGIMQIFNYSIAQVSSLYNSNFSVALFNPKLFICIIGSATIIGWMGSYIAVNRSIQSFKIN